MRSRWRSPSSSLRLPWSGACCLRCTYVADRIPFQVLRLRLPLDDTERGMLPGVAAGALAIGLLAFAFRYLTVGTIENDHFVMLARAQQVLHGDWPVRDFEDPGQPLFYLLTAGAA